MTTLTTPAKSSAPFARSAAYYDEIYRDRGPIYDRDVRRILSLFGKFAGRLPRRMVDWGAGTCEHLRQFKLREWQAVGFDPCPQMVAQGIAKGANIIRGDIRGLDSRAFESEFSLQTCLFASFSYATLSDADLSYALTEVRRVAFPGGLFVFDVVNHSAAASHLHDDPKSNRAIDTGRIWRSMRKSFDIKTSIVTAEMSYQVKRDEKNEPDCFTEIHKLRAYTPREISAALTRHGFDVLEMFDPESESIEGGPIRADSYYFMVVARVR